MIADVESFGMADDMTAVLEIQRGVNVDAHLQALAKKHAGLIFSAARTSGNAQFQHDTINDALAWVHKAALKFDPAKSSSFLASLFQQVRWHALHFISSRYDRITVIDRQTNKVKQVRRYREFVPVENLDFLDEQSDSDFDPAAAKKAIERLAEEDREFVRQVLPHPTQKDAAKQMGLPRPVLSNRLSEIRPLLARYYREAQDDTDTHQKRFMENAKQIVAANADLFTISKDIPLPPRPAPPTGRKYPIAELEVGHSFFEPGRSRQRLRNAANWYRQSHGAMHRTFECRQRIEDGIDGCRIWRVT